MMRKPFPARIALLVWAGYKPILRENLNQQQRESGRFSLGNEVFVLKDLLII